MLRKVLTLLAAIAIFCLGAVADESYQLYINGVPSTQGLLKEQGQDLVPLNFPVQSQEAEWTVTVRRDAHDRKVQVQMGPTRRPKRSENPCHLCMGSGKCQSCYPPGSGKTPKGRPNPACNATGKCVYCRGEGKW